MEEVIPYRKLVGLTRNRGLFSFGFRKLYEGPDHLLLIDTTTYTEDYKRFYYTDIQSITVHKTKRFVNLCLWLTVSILLCATLAPTGLWLAQQNSGGVAEGLGYALAAMAGIPAPILIAALIVNIVKGATCRTVIKTAVQEEELTPLRRLRKANRIVPELRQRIEAAQGALSPETLAQQLTAFGQRTAAAAPPITPPVAPPPIIPPPLS